MREVVLCRDIRSDIIRRLNVIGVDLNKELVEGLEADWTSIALEFESIKDAAGAAAQAAWLVQYEGAE